MKKIFFVCFAAIAAACLTSCDNDELNVVNERFEKLRIAEEQTSQPQKRGEHERLSEYLARIRGEFPQKKK